MSEEQLKAFIAKVQADTSLQKQLQGIGLDNHADVVDIAKAAGFAITEAEVKSFQQRDLSDEELEDVAGGKGGGVPDWVKFCARSQLTGVR